MIVHDGSGDKILNINNFNLEGDNGWKHSIERFPIFNFGLRLTLMILIGNIIYLLITLSRYSETHDNQQLWILILLLSSFTIFILFLIIIILNTYRMRKLTQNMIVKPYISPTDAVYNQILYYFNKKNINYEEKSINDIHKWFVPRNLHTIEKIINILSLDFAIIIWNSNDQEIKNQFGDIFIGPISNENYAIIKELLQEIKNVL